MWFLDLTGEENLSPNIFLGPFCFGLVFLKSRNKEKKYRVFLYSSVLFLIAKLWLNCIVLEYYGDDRKSKPQLDKGK